MNKIMVNSLCLRLFMCLIYIGIYRAHRAVIFMIARLSCYRSHDVGFNAAVLSVFPFFLSLKFWNLFSKFKALKVLENRVGP